MRFVLNKERRHFPPVDSDGSEAVFSISNVSREQSGSYSCYYHSRSEPFAVSYPSDPVELVVRGERPGLNFLLPAPCGVPAPWALPGMGGLRGREQTSCSWHLRLCCFPGGSEPPAPLGLTSPIIIGVSVVAAALLLLLVAFVCFRKTRARKGSTPRPSSTSPSGMLEAPAHQDPIYSSMDERKQPPTLEPDPGTDGLTYVELDDQALQAKRGGLARAPEPAQHSVYAVINVSQGTPQ
nr:leukocyte immunoglobulin-like receptor subfamily B member 2 [Chrysemys picta bellii]